MILQPDLFGAEPSSEASAAAPAAVWGVRRLVDAEDAWELEVSWGAYRFDQAAHERQLVRFFERSTAYRAFRCILCRRPAVVSLAEWQSPAAQVVKCAYRGCGGWVQRDSEPVGGGESSERADDHAGGVARDRGSAQGAGGGAPGRDCGLADGADGDWFAAAAEPSEPPDPLYD